MKILCVVLAVIMLSALAHCGGSKGNFVITTNDKAGGKSGAGKGVDKNAVEIDDVVKPGQVIACYFDPHLFSAEFGVAKLIVPASDATKGYYEVEWLYNSHATAPGKRSKVKLVITKSHPARKDEIVPGTVVLYGAVNKFGRAVVRGYDSAKGVVLLEWFHAPGERVNAAESPLESVRIIDEPVMTDPRKK